MYSGWFITTPECCTVYHALPRGASFWRLLFNIDRDLAARARQQGCPCGGRLDCAHFPRKPQGGGRDFPKEYGYRLSFCCAREGCRKRVTPPSARFLGRKVYLGAVVVLVAALREGPTPRRVRELTELFGADRTTIARWQVFWREQFPQTPFWRVERGRLVPAVEAGAVLPGALLDAFLGQQDRDQDWGRLLEFLAPSAVAGGRESTVFR